MPWCVPIGTSHTERSLRVRRRAVERVPADPGADRRPGDALGVQPEEDLAQAVTLGADEAVGADLDVVEEQLELLLGRADLHRDERALEPGRVGVDDQDRQLRFAGLLVGARARDDDHARRFVDTGDVGLRPAQPVELAVACRSGGEAMRVGAGIGLGDRERHLLARDHPGEPRLALLVGAEPRDQLGADRGRHQDEQQRAPLRSKLLADDRELGDPPTTPAVLFGQVHTQEPVVRHRLPELGGVGAVADGGGVVVVPEARREVAHGRAQQLVLGGLDEVHAGQAPIPTTSMPSHACPHTVSTMPFIDPPCTPNVIRE